MAFRLWRRPRKLAARPSVLGTLVGGSRGNDRRGYARGPMFNRPAAVVDVDERHARLGWDDELAVRRGDPAGSTDTQAENATATAAGAVVDRGGAEASARAQVEAEPASRRPAGVVSLLERLSVGGDLAEGEARSIVNPVLQADNRGAAVAHVGERLWWLVRYHGLRVVCGWYPLLVAIRATHGASRLLAAWWRWAADERRVFGIEAALQVGDHHSALVGELDHERAVRVRRPIAIAGAVVVVASPWLALRLVAGGGLAGMAVAAGWVGYLAWWGRPTDGRQFWGTPVTAEGPARQITDVMIRGAFVDAGLARNNDPESIDFATPVTQNHKAGGWETQVVLPGNHHAGEAIGKRMAIAAGLDVDEQRVFLDRIRGEAASARRVSLFVANRDPFSAEPITTPLAQVDQLDIMDPFPFGTTPRRDEVRLSLPGTNVMVGAEPGAGKTFTVRLFAAAVALDPFALLSLFDGKGGADWLAFERIAYRCGIGARDAVVKHLRSFTDELLVNVEWRYDRLRDFARAGMVTESKITKAIARNPELGFPMHIVVIDEIQNYLDHDTHGEAIKDNLIRLARTARAVGIVLVMATQRPDSGTVPTKLRDVCGTRLCGRVGDPATAKMILGKVPAGANPVDILRPQRGTVVSLGTDDTNAAAQFDAMFVRAHLGDDPCIDTIATRGYDLRRGEDTLAGAAAGDQVLEEENPTRLLDDIISVFRPGERKQWLDNLCGRLAERAPQTYSGWGPRLLGANFKGKGVETRDVWAQPDAGGPATTRRGVELADVLDAHARRSHPNGSGGPG